MVFSSLPFIFWFLPIFLGVYAIVPKKLKNLVLFIFSLVFYAWGEPIYIVFMLFSTLFDYINGLLIERYGSRTKKSKIVMIVSCIGNLGLLCIFKYFDFLAGNINTFLDISIPLLGISLPIGISFYTFQTMSYTIDVYKGIVPAQHNIITFGSYVAMFPQLIAGPIVQYKTVEIELNNRSVTIDDVYIGVRRFIIGFSKKVFLANNIGFIWSEILKNYSSFSILTLWLGLLCFSFQIYFDFSGYSDMAIGLGRMLGFKFLENFNYPYISRSITEFWRRWHISLGSWFREYVYIPLGGNRCKLSRQLFNLSVVWLLTGIWHGAAWNYIIWGIYYGLIIILEKVWLLKKLERLSHIFQHIYSLFLIVLGWCIFAIEDISILRNYLSMLIYNINGFIDTSFWYYLSNYFILFICCILCSLSICNEKYSKFVKTDSKYCIIVDILLFIVFIISLGFLVNSTYNPFLYFRF